MNHRDLGFIKVGRYLDRNSLHASRGGYSNVKGCENLPAFHEESSAINKRVMFLFGM